MFSSSVFRQVFSVKCFSSSVFRQAFSVKRFPSIVFRQMFSVNCVPQKVHHFRDGGVFRQQSNFDLGNGFTIVSRKSTLKNNDVSRYVLEPLGPTWAPERLQKGGQKGPKRRQKRDQNDMEILIDF